MTISANEEKFDVAIIGGGYTGVFSALLLSRLKNADGAPALRVCLLERDEHLMNGSSLVPARLHLGGEYPKDPVTARQCLLGAMLFRQMLPTDDILTDRRCLDFLVKNSESLGFEEMKERYEGLRIIYEGLFEKILGTGDATERKRLEEQLFGSPKKGVFWRELLESENPNKSHFSGGIRTPERGFQPIATGVLLENLLNDPEYRVTVYNQFNLKETKCKAANTYSQDKKHYRYELVPEKGRWARIVSRFVVNATGYESEEIDGTIRLKGESPPPTTVYVRSLGLFDVSECSIPEDRSYFGLIGGDGGMVSAFNKETAAVYVVRADPEKKLQCISDKNEPWGPKPQCQEASIQAEAEKAFIFAEMLENIKGKYPFMKDAKPAKPSCLITRTTVSWDEDTSQRQHIKPVWMEKETHWLVARSTKATLAPLTALQVVGELMAHQDIEKEFVLLEESRNFLNGMVRVGLYGKDIYDRDFPINSVGSSDSRTGSTEVVASLKNFAKLPREFVIDTWIRPTGSSMRKYASNRGLPGEIIENISLFEEAKRITGNKTARASSILKREIKKVKRGASRASENIGRMVVENRQQLIPLGIAATALITGTAGGFTGDYLDGAETSWGLGFWTGATTGAIGGGTTAILATRRWF